MLYLPRIARAQPQVLHGVFVGPDAAQDSFLKGLKFVGCQFTFKNAFLDTLAKAFQHACAASTARVHCPIG